MHYLRNRYKDATLFENCRRIPRSQRSDKRRGRFNSMQVETLLALETSAQGVAVKKSTIPHPDAVIGLFASR